jgi:RNA polymerase sigma factor for flagellar operon FliA
MTGYRRELTDDEKERIINDSLPFIKYTAYRLARRLPPQMDVEDLISVGIMGLLDALQRFEEGRVKINTFVEHRIRGAMLDELRSQDWVPRSVKKKVEAIRKGHQKLQAELGRPPEDDEVAKSIGVSLDEYYRTLQDAHNAVCFSFEDFHERLFGDDEGDVLSCIPDRSGKGQLEVMEENAVVEDLAQRIETLPEKEKLVLSLYYWDELTMKEIGNVLGLTEGRVCQLHSQAVLRLKAQMDVPVPVVRPVDGKVPCRPGAMGARPRGGRTPVVPHSAVPIPGKHRRHSVKV